MLQMVIVKNKTPSVLAWCISEIDKNDGLINNILYNLINSLGLSESVTSILILISIAFILKAIITFLSLGFTAFLLGDLLKKIKMRLFSHYSNMSFGYFSSKNSGDLINLINEQPTKALESFKQLSLLGSHFINTIIFIWHNISSLSYKKLSTYHFSIFKINNT